MLDNEKNHDGEILSYNVAWLRKRHGLSQKSMAQLLHIGVWSLRKLENGELPPRMTIDVLYYIFKHFHIPMADLLSKRLED